MSNVDRIIKRYDRLKANRGVWDSHWREIAELIYPRRDDFDTKRAPGEKRQQRLFSSTPIKANELLASALVSLSVSPATKWFKANTDNFDEDGKRWLDNASEIMLNSINASSSNFYTSMYEYFLEFSAFGTAGLFIDENENKDGLIFQARSLTEIVIAESAAGVIDTVYRRFEWTVQQIMEHWPDNTSKSIAKAIEAERFDQKLFIIHCIQPRKERDASKKTADNMPIESAYVLQVDRTLLEEGGFQEMPLTVGRFYKSPMETYGRSPAMTALPDVKVLNEMVRVMLQAGQKSVDPPLIVANDGFLGSLRLKPGGVNTFFGNPNEAIAQLPPARMDIGEALINSYEDKVRSTFFVDQLQFTGGPQMTATEVLQRTEEKTRLIGPVTGRVNSEVLGPTLERVFGILFRQGKFGPPPESIGASFDFEYTNQIAQAQKQQEANGFLRAVQSMAPLLELQPTLLIENINGDKLLRDTMQEFGVNMDKLTQEEERDASRQQRQELEAQQQQAAMVQQSAEAGQAVQQVAQAAQ
ncbi:MAG: portal protein [Thiotrichaceae bacterium]